MTRPVMYGLVLVLAADALAFAQAPKEFPGVARVLEDNGEELLKNLTNPTGDPGEGHLEKTTVFSGQSSVKIIPLQRFSPKIEGWNFRIVEKPGPGEFRYLRFAWKADGNNGIMLQLHDQKDWSLRYTAGVDRYSWGTKYVTDKLPNEWTVVTCDLFKDFGDRVLHGIALTAFEGNAAYFDHIYFGRSVEDLDRIDATGFRDEPAKDLSIDELELLWRNLVHDKGELAYRALWRMVARPKSSVPFLKAKLAKVTNVANQDKIDLWIKKLDDERFLVREEATRQLEKNLQTAVERLRDALLGDLSAESKRRIEFLVKLNPSKTSDPERADKAIRILEYADTPESRAALTELSNRVGTRLAPAASIALRRLPADKK